MESSLVGILALAFLRALAWGYYLLPVSGKKIAAKALGALLRAFNIRRKVVQQNVEIAFPKDPAQQMKIAHEAYTHLAYLFFEILMLLGPMDRYVRKFGVLKGLENWEEAKRRGKGMIFLSSHVGNWEIMAATGTLHGGMDLMLVTKHLKPEWFHKAIEQGRSRCRVDATYEPRTLKDVLSRLKKNGTVGFVLDQYAGPPVGIRVPVFGVPVGTSMALATLAKRTGATILPVVNFREPNGQLVVEIKKPLAWTENPDPTEELAVNTAAYARELEADILAHPEQWLWIHRRFKGDLSPMRAGEWAEGRIRH